LKTFLYSILLVIFFDCNSYKVNQIFPENVSDKRKIIYVENWNKGKILYKNNCASCHGLLQKNVKNIPDFSLKQIDTYTAKFKISDSTNHAFTKKLSTEELENIFFFIHYFDRKDNKNAAQH
jgi:hypothetical protein